MKDRSSTHAEELSFNEELSFDQWVEELSLKIYPLTHHHPTMQSLPFPLQSPSMLMQKKLISLDQEYHFFLTSDLHVFQHQHSLMLLQLHHLLHSRWPCCYWRARESPSSFSTERGLDDEEKVDALWSQLQNNNVDRS